MKNKAAFMIAALLAVLGLVGAAVSYANSGVEVVEVKLSDVINGSKVVLYVAPDGSDINAGTADSPLKTMMGAFERIRQLKPEIEQQNAEGKEKIAAITVLLSGGTYSVNDSNSVRVDGSFFPAGVSCTFKALEGQTPVVDGGMKVENWQTTQLNGRSVLAAQLEKNLDGIYSLNVNGINATLAHSMTDPEFEGSNLSKQNQKKHSYIDDEGSFTWEFVDVAHKENGLRVTSNQNVLRSLVSPSQTQAVWLIEWKEFMIRLDRLEGDVIRSDYWPVIASIIDVADHPDWFWPAPIHNFYLQNDISLIDRPGEFCYDRASGMLYYYPLEVQTAQNITAVVPMASKLMDLSTTAKKGFIENVTFEGITFANTAVDYIDTYGGFAINQAQQFEAGRAQKQGQSWAAIRETMDGAITLNYCRNVTFRDCRFVNLGLSAIKMEIGCQNCHIEGCVFQDLGNSAIVLSAPDGYALKGASRTVDNTIENCVIRRIGRINLSSPAILVYYSQHTTIMHNDISDCPYTAISVGWGWTGVKDSYANSNVISFNKVGNYLKKLKDGGGIYTLNSQPYSSIEYNYFYSQRNNYAAIYLDEGTSGYTVSDNAVFLNGLIDENGAYYLDEDDEPIDRFYKESEQLTWFYINDATPYAGTTDSPSRGIKAVRNYFCCGNGYGKILSHPDNIIPPVQNDDLSHPELRNVEFGDYDAFFADPNVAAVISMAGLEEEYKHLLE